MTTASAPAPVPAGPKGQFLLGHNGPVARDPLGFLTRCAREYGDFVPLRFGRIQGLLLCHPDYIEQVLVTQNASFNKGAAPLITFYFGGHETTALALTWAWYLLAQYPEVEAMLHAELETALGGRAPSAADLPRLRYTEAIVKESLRLYPPTWAFGREALVDCQIGGYRVARGTQIALIPWVVHRDPRFFDEPEAMKPERWLDGADRNLPRFAYFPLGGGQRMWIGSAFAMLEAVMVLATIAQRYHLALAPGQTVTPQAALTLQPAGGLKLRLRRR